MLDMTTERMQADPKMRAVARIMASIAIRVAAKKQKGAGCHARMGERPAGAEEMETACPSTVSPATEAERSNAL